MSYVRLSINPMSKHNLKLKTASAVFFSPEVFIPKLCTVNGAILKNYINGNSTNQIPSSTITVNMGNNLAI